MPRRGKRNGEKLTKSCKRDSGLDKFSSLPNHVIDQILSCLPIRDAVSTSVLSSEWRFKWTTMSVLVFDKECLPFTPQDHPMRMVNFVNFIDQAVLGHTGPISKFMLYQRHPISKTDLDRWILHLSKCHVQELKLGIWEGQFYKLHSCISSFQDLVHLDLYRCHLNLPSTFGGFKKLKILDLQSVTAAQDVFETLIFSCPILEDLTLFNNDGLTQLNIDAPNLLKFDFEGYFHDINFINSSNLESACIEVVVPAELQGDATERLKAFSQKKERLKARDFSNLLKFFSDLSRINSLEIQGHFLEYLAIGVIPGQLPNPCPDLRYLYLEIYFDDSTESSAALCLLRSSPNIQKLDIGVYGSLEEDEDTVWKNEEKNCSFNKLQVVRIDCVCVTKSELEFIRFMLLASPVLEKMIITPAENCEVPQLAREVLGFQRASTKAEVVVIGSLD